jgi:toxin-antitoxin system PIN domain toxin
VSSAFLLDVNVLIAMTWPAHRAHGKVQQWLAHRTREKWATCPFTEAAFVRILSNPAFSPDALTPADAVALLRSNLAHPAHQFWPGDIGLLDAIAYCEPRIIGHQQITDAYLLGLAFHRKEKLVTLDSSIASLVPEKNPARDAITLI